MAESPYRKKNALKGKGGLVMLGLAAALGGWLLLDLRGKPVRDPDAPPPVTDYSHAAAADVARVELKRPGGGFTLVKREGRWTFEAPARWAANTDSVDRWLKGLLDDATVSQAVTGRPDDAAAGFDKPAAELVLTTSGGETRTIQVGKPFPTVGGAGASPLVYAREAKDGRVFMLSSSQASDLKGKKAEELRDKRLLDLADTKSVKKVVLERPSGALELERQAEDKWQIVRPIHAPAGSDTAAGLVDSARSEADAFVEKPEADLSRYGLDKPVLTLRVTDKSGDHAVLFGSSEPGGKVYAVRQGSQEVELVSRANFERVNKQMAQLRELKLMTLDPDKVSYVELTNPNGKVRLQKVSGGQWQLADATDPKQKKAKGDVVQQVITAIGGLAARHVEEAPTDLAKYGLDKPQITVQVNDGSGTSQVFAVGKQAQKESYYAKGVGTAVFEVPTVTFRDLSLKPDAFRDTTPAK
jgi:hypothetical protein